MSTDMREPACIHSVYPNTQPASACSVCKDRPELAEWKRYWREHPERMPADVRREFEQHRQEWE